MGTHYEVLGVSRNASPKALARAYERRIKALGRNPDALQERIVRDAFAVLSNPAKRVDYDSRLGEFDVMPVGSGSSVPLIVGLVVVALTAGAIGFFLVQRSKDQQWMKHEEQRAAAKRERDRRAPGPQAREMGSDPK